MNWIILVIKGKDSNRDYLSSGERKDKNKVKKNKNLLEYKTIYVIVIYIKIDLMNYTNYEFV